MNLLVSLVLTVGLQQPVPVYGCCPLTNVIVWRVVPVLVVAPPAPRHEPREMGAVPHVARI